MKLKFTLLISVFFCLGLSAQNLQTFYDFSWPTIAGDTISMAQYAGKKLMVVNCASYCSYTPQYTPLKELDSMYAAKYNFTIVGYPCNDFGNQGGNDSQVITTCHNYEVNFQIMSTVSIVTGDTAPLYKWLQRRDLNGVSNAHVSWNFNKFLIDRQGHWVRWLDSPVNPLDTSIINWIKEDSALAYPLPTLDTSRVNWMPQSSLSAFTNATGLSFITAGASSIILKSANPANNELALEISGSMSQTMNIDLYNVDGRLVAPVYSGIVMGVQQVNYPVTNLPAGVYLIRAQALGYNKTLKVVIQH